MYGDEQIIEKKNEYKKGQYGDIQSGVYIKNDLYKFERFEFFDKKLSIMLPTEFIDLPEKVAKVKYPSEARPPVIKSNRIGDVNFTLNILDVPAKPEDMNTITNQFCEVTKKLQPANLYYEKKVESIRSNKLGWFDYKSCAIDSKLYNIMYLTVINGKLLHGIFNCKYEDFDLWKAVALQVIRSIECEVE